jgi:hypothetical protein
MTTKPTGWKHESKRHTDAYYLGRQKTVQKLRKKLDIEKKDEEKYLQKRYINTTGVLKTINDIDRFKRLTPKGAKFEWKLHKQNSGAIMGSSLTLKYIFKSMVRRDGKATVPNEIIIQVSGTSSKSVHVHVKKAVSIHAYVDLLSNSYDLEDLFSLTEKLLKEFNNKESALVRVMKWYSITQMNLNSHGWWEGTVIVN